MLRLSVVRGIDRPASITFSEGKVRLGAHAENHLALKDPRVSGLHAELAVELGGIRLRDPGSTNGTWVNDVRVQDAYLNPGAELRLGDTWLSLEEAGGETELELPPSNAFGPLLGQSPSMRALFARLAKIAAHDVPVLISGETGTGKDVVAHAIHEAGTRAQEPLVTVECAAIPVGLIESELFGHERGAFTGAERTFPGAFERAGGGTVLLDEIGDLPLALQPKLLRALESLEIRRLGADKPRAIKARIMAATHRDIAKMVSQGTFRSDLYFRLAVAEVDVPALRERAEDIPLLVDHFLADLPDAAPISADTLSKLRQHSWPGNVRELRNAVQRVALLGDPPPTPGKQPAMSDPHLRARLHLPYKQARDETLAEFRRMYAAQALDRCGGSISAAARLAQVDRMTFYRMLGQRDQES